MLLQARTSLRPTLVRRRVVRRLAQKVVRRRMKDLSRAKVRKGWKAPGNPLALPSLARGSRTLMMRTMSLQVKRRRRPSPDVEESAASHMFHIVVGSRASTYAITGENGSSRCMLETCVLPNLTCIAMIHANEYLTYVGNVSFYLFTYPGSHGRRCHHRFRLLTSNFIEPHRRPDNPEVRTDESSPFFTVFTPQIRQST
jgi:hypothetical protein